MLKNVMSKALSISGSPIFYEFAGKSALNKPISSLFTPKGVLHDMNIRYFSLSQQKSETSRKYPNETSKAEEALQKAIDTVKMGDFLTVGANLFDAQRTGGLSPVAFETLFDNYQKKLAQAIPTMPINDLCRVSNILSLNPSEDRDNDELWSKLKLRVQNAISNGKIDISNTALFFYSLSNKVRISSNEWNTLQDSCFKNLKQANTAAIAQLFSIFSKVSTQEQYDNPEREGRPTKEKEITKIYLDLLGQRLHNANLSVLYMVGDALNELKSQRHDIWESLEDRFKEIISEISPEDLGKFAVLLSQGQKGSSSLWRNLEEYFLEAGPYLNPEALGSFIEAFGHRQKVGKYFWNQAEKYVMAQKKDIKSASVATSMVLGFSIAKAGAPKLWNFLEETLCNDPEKINPASYEAILYAFHGKSWCGSKIWERIEGELENDLHTYEPEAKAGIYLILEKYNKLTPEWEELLQEARPLIDKLKDFENELDPEKVEELLQNEALFEDSRYEFNENTIVDLDKEGGEPASESVAHHETEEQANPEETETVEDGEAKEEEEQKTE